MTGKVTDKVTDKVAEKVTEKVTERRHLEMQFCNDAIDERAIRLPYNGRKRNASLTTHALDKRIRIESGVMDMRLLRLPIYSAEARREFDSMCFMMCYASTTETVTRTVFRTRTLNIIMWTGHILTFYFSGIM